MYYCQTITRCLPEAFSVYSSRLLLRNFAIPSDYYVIPIPGNADAANTNICVSRTDEMLRPQLSSTIAAAKLWQSVSDLRSI